MGSVIVQLYEIQTPEEAELVIREGCDHVGSVLQDSETIENTILRKTIETVHEIGKSRNVRSSLIPLFSDAQKISLALDYYAPDIVHFCEDVISLKNGEWDLHPDVERLYKVQETIKARFPEIKTMRSIPIPVKGYADTGVTLKLARFFADISDFFLTDTLILNEKMIEADKEVTKGEQPETGFVGITGKTCDWDVARALVLGTHVPVVLAGGMSPDNVAQGIEKVKPYGVDSCTLTNYKDEYGKSIRFKKDPELVRRFITNAKEMERTL